LENWPWMKPVVRPEKNALQILCQCSLSLHRKISSLERSQAWKDINSLPSPLLKMLLQFSVFLAITYF
jgi:hypothetical protein